MLNDIRSAIRALVRARAFTLTAVLTLAAGAGVTAAIFAVVHGVMLRPLPFAEPDRLVAVWPQRFQSNADLSYLRDVDSPFSRLAAIAPGWTMAVTGAGEPVKLTVARTSGNFFETLGTPPHLGRVFSEAQARPGAPAAIVLSYDAWMRHFGGDPSLVGRIVRLDGTPAEVIGVMPRQFEVLGVRADGYAAFPFDTTAWYHQVALSFFIARLDDAVTFDEAGVRYAALIPEVRKARGYRDDYGRTARLETLQTATVGDVSSAMLLLAGAVGLTLLLAAANVASLQLTRTAARRRELAVRVSLGASRARLARELAVESGTLALAAGVAGVAVAYVSLPALIAMLPPDTPRVGDIAIDAPLAGAVLGVTVLLSLLVGLAPAFAATRVTPEAALRSGNSSEVARAKRLRGAMVAVEVALAVMLAIGAGLMLQTLRNLHEVDTGFDTDQVLTIHLQPDPMKHGRSVATFYDQVIERVRAVPGVSAAGAIQHLPFSGYSWNASLDVEGVAVAAGESRPVAGLRIATPGYFGAIGQPLIAGREFERIDSTRGTSVIVNAAFATRYFTSASAALGRTLRINGAGLTSPWMTIVGVAGDVRHSSLLTAPVPEIYTVAGAETITAMMLAIRASGDPLSLVPAVRAAIWSIDRDVPLSDVETMAAKVGTSVSRPRLLTSLLASFAGLGVLLAAVGIYSVVAHSVAQRRREIGIMVALGAGRRRVAATVMAEGARYAVAGLALGIPAAVWGSRLLDTLVFGVEPVDAAIYAAMAAATLATVTAACLRPALGAAGTDPAITIRQS